MAATTNVDLNLGLNLEIGSIPVTLQASINKENTQTDYLFDGSIQDADVTLNDFFSVVGRTFGLDFQLPPELNLEIKIDYIAAQLSITKESAGSTNAKTTDLGISGKFDFILGDTTLLWKFFAAAQLSGHGSGATATKPYALGFVLEPDPDSSGSNAVILDFKKIPVLGSIPGFNDLSLEKIGFSYNSGTETNAFTIPVVTSPPPPNPLYTRTSGSSKNQYIYKIDSESANSEFKIGQKGFALTAAIQTSGGTTDNFALPLALDPTTPNNTPTAFHPGTTSPPGQPIHWIKINKTFGPVKLEKIGLNYSKGEMTFGISAHFVHGLIFLWCRGTLHHFSHAIARS